MPLCGKNVPLLFRFMADSTMVMMSYHGYALQVLATKVWDEDISLVSTATIMLWKPSWNCVSALYGVWE